ncbi:MAG: alpha/beta fold hydrolase [Bacteroidota bacterium]
MLIQLLHRMVRMRLGLLGLASERVELKSCSLHYYEFTHPQPKNTLVLLHGLGTSSSTWFHLYPFLTREHSVIALDFPGFGFSTTRDGGPMLSIGRHLEALETFVEQKELPSFILVGHSLGGWIAAKYASAHQQKVNRLVLINTAGVYVGGVDALLRAFDIHTTNDVRQLVNAIWYRYPWYFKPFLPTIRSELVKRGVPQFVRSIQREDFFDGELQRLEMPVHLIWGTEDRLISSETVRVLKEQLPLLHVEYIKTCGHVPQLERPERMKEIFEKMLERKDE